MTNGQLKPKVVMSGGHALFEAQERFATKVFDQGAIEARYVVSVAAKACVKPMQVMPPQKIEVCGDQYVLEAHHSNVAHVAAIWPVKHKYQMCRHKFRGATHTVKTMTLLPPEEREPAKRPKNS